MIESAKDRDLPEVRALLERLHLPLDGVDEHVKTMLVAREDGHVVGTAALELYEDGACCGLSLSILASKASGSATS